jgi:hypothetical protein
VSLLLGLFPYRLHTAIQRQDRLKTSGEPEELEQDSDLQDDQVIEDQQLLLPMFHLVAQGTGLADGVSDTEKGRIAYPTHEQRRGEQQQSYPKRQLSEELPEHPL